MSTLKELFEKHGSVWLSLKDKPRMKHFKPLGISEEGRNVIGEKADGIADFYPARTTCFQLYSEPKKQVKKWLWRFQNENDDWVATPGFKSEKEVSAYGDRYIKLLWSEIEVEAE